MRGFSFEDFPDQHPLKRRICDEKTLAIHDFARGVQLPCLPDFFSASNSVSVPGRVTKAILGCLKQPYPKHYSTLFTWESSLEEIKVKVFNLFYWHFAMASQIVFFWESLISGIPKYLNLHGNFGTLFCHLKQIFGRMFCQRGSSD